MEQATFDRVNEERRELISEIVSSVLSQVIPQVKQELTAGYLEQITSIVNRRFDDLDNATEARHNALVKQTEERFAQTATKEELAGVTLSGAENTGRINKLEAATDARLKLLEEGFKSLNESDKQHRLEIKDIKASSTKTADNAQKTSEAVIELIEEFRQWKAESTRELNAVKDAQKTDEKALQTTNEKVLVQKETTAGLIAEVGELRGDIGATVRPMQDTVRDLKPRVSNLEAQTAQAALVLDKIEWVAGGVRWLFKERTGNIVLALILAGLVGFQIYYAVLSYQMNQSYQQLIAFLGH